MRHLLALLTLALAASAKANYYGTLVGEFNNRFHGIKGKVYAVDSRTLFIKGFSYDGQVRTSVLYLLESGDQE